MFYPFLIADFYKIYQPKTKAFLTMYENQAQKIPDPKLKKEALASLKAKAFHCYGASFYTSLVSEVFQTDYVRFMTAYQTMCDYLDNLVDQTAVINETNFRRLHQSLLDVFTMPTFLQNYYQYQAQQLDGGYLNKLVRLCQESLRRIPNYKKYLPLLHHLAELYVDLQVYKHLNFSEREERLIQLKDRYKTLARDLTWYEFSAACGSTLGIFTMVAYGMNDKFEALEPDLIFQSMFPEVQQLHIMLDYLIDLEEDLEDGELNFFAYYPDVDDGIKKILNVYQEAQKKVEILPNKSFHQTINDGLLALYLAEGIRKNPMLSDVKKQVMRQVGFRARFLFYHTQKFVR